MTIHMLLGSEQKVTVSVKSLTWCFPHLFVISVTLQNVVDFASNIQRQGPLFSGKFEFFIKADFGILSFFSTAGALVVVTV